MKFQNSAFPVVLAKITDRLPFASRGSLKTSNLNETLGSILVVQSGNASE